jgi:hypothetical protein
MNLFFKKAQECGMHKFIRSHTPTFIFNLGLVWRFIFLPLVIIEGVENMSLLWNTFSLAFGGPSFEGISKCELSCRVQYTQSLNVFKWVKYCFTYTNQSLSFSLNLNPKPCYSTFCSQSPLNHVNCGGLRWFFRFLRLGSMEFTLHEEWVNLYRGTQNFLLYMPTLWGMFCSLPESALYQPHILGPLEFEISKHYKTTHYIVEDKP